MRYTEVPLVALPEDIHWLNHLKEVYTRVSLTDLLISHYMAESLPSEVSDVHMSFLSKKSHLLGLAHPWKEVNKPLSSPLQGQHECSYL